MARLTLSPESGQSIVCFNTLAFQSSGSKSSEGGFLAVAAAAAAAGGASAAIARNGVLRTPKELSIGLFCVRIRTRTYTFFVCRRLGYAHSILLQLA